MYGVEVQLHAFSLLQNVQTGSEAHPASYTMGTGECFPEGKKASA
jgi:hypothetical protein